MVLMSGKSPTEIKINQTIKINDGDIILGLNQNFLLNAVIKYNLNKYMIVTGACELFPSNITKRRQKIVKSMGIGLTAKYSSMETLMDVEEDFSEYEYENL